ncbi:hypothetical protein B0H13DRAFT_1935784 [Mycena leptocephala]|nr:hypothetical protein B0H13DRAFT_1935784 [Mycena leptocephala]
MSIMQYELMRYEKDDCILWPKGGSALEPRRSGRRDCTTGVAHANGKTGVAGTLFERQICVAPQAIGLALDNQTSYRDSEETVLLRIALAIFGKCPAGDEAFIECTNGLLDRVQPAQTLLVRVHIRFCPVAPDLVSCVPSIHVWDKRGQRAGCRPVPVQVIRILVKENTSVARAETKSISVHQSSLPEHHASRPSSARTVTRIPRVVTRYAPRSPFGPHQRQGGAIDTGDSERPAIGGNVLRARRQHFEKAPDSGIFESLFHTRSIFGWLHRFLQDF